MARNNEAELSAELRQIECALVMVFEDNRLRPSPPEARLPPSVSDSYELNIHFILIPRLIATANRPETWQSS